MLFQTHYFSENLVAPGIEPGTFGSVARTSDLMKCLILKILKYSRILSSIDIW
jgi:hypothetical protein